MLLNQSRARDPGAFPPELGLPEDAMVPATPCLHQR
jgi:hypothetical protein